MKLPHKLTRSGKLLQSLVDAEIEKQNTRH